MADESGSGASPLVVVIVAVVSALTLSDSGSRGPPAGLSEGLARRPLAHPRVEGSFESFLPVLKIERFTAEHDAPSNPRPPRFSDLRTPASFPVPIATFVFRYP